MLNKVLTEKEQSDGLHGKEMVILPVVDVVVGDVADADVAWLETLA